VLVKARYVSLDAANRAWMQGVTYRAALGTGEVMAGGSLAEVVESRSPGLAPGDLVHAETGWQEYAAVPAKHLEKLPKVEPLTHLLSVYGVTGLTAYLGLLRVGDPKPGETVVVSAAAGAVGSIAAQVAKLKGCKVIGIAGGAEKCAWLTDELGLDGAVDYKQGDVRRALRAACPDGIDVYFDNVGGDIFEAALFNMANHGRIVCCGAVSQYDDVPPARRTRPDRHQAAKGRRLRGDGLLRRQGRRPGAAARLGRGREAEGAGGRYRRPGEPAVSADRPAGGREPRQADGAGGVSGAGCMPPASPP
jgi:hypothetical protein